jgi:hypothetical protein
MNNQSNSNIEQKLSALYAVDPAGDFVNRLEKDLLAQNRQPAKAPAWRLWKMNLSQSRGLTRLAWAGAAVLVLAALLFATPQGRAWAQEIIHFFTRTASDTLPYTPEPLTWVGVTPSAVPSTPTPMAAFAAACGDFDNPKCSIDQIQSKVNFPVKQLGTVPEGMHFVGATGGPEFIEILYANGTYGWGAVILEGPWTSNSAIAQWQIGSTAIVETVQVGSASGEYVKGGFAVAADGTTQVWDVNAGMQTLHWVDQDVFFSLEEFGPAAILDKAALVALAEGLTTGPVTVSLTPMPATETPAPGIITNNGVRYDLSVAQVSQQAGFDVLQPKRLPDILSFAGAAYQPEDHIARMFYIDRVVGLPNLYGLTLSEQLASNPVECKLCGILTGDYGDPVKSKSGMVVGAGAVIESVKIGDLTGQYVEGYWMPTSGFFSWVSAPFVKTLHWQAQGKAFELQYSGYSINNNVPIGKADLIAIAEDMMK